MQKHEARQACTWPVQNGGAHTMDLLDEPREANGVSDTSPSPVGFLMVRLEGGTSYIK